MRPDEKLSSYEAVCLFGVTFLVYVFSEITPILVRALGPAAWMANAGCVFLFFPYLGIFWLLYRRYHEMDFLVICDTVYGKVFSKVILVLLLIHLFLYNSSILSRCVETLQIYAYAKVGAFTIDLVVLGAVAVIALYSVKGLAKIISVILPLIAAVIVFLLILSRDQYDANLLTPFWGRDPRETALMSVESASMFNGVLVLSVFGGAFQNKRQYGKTVVLAAVAAGLLSTAVTFCYCMAIPYSSAKDISVGMVGLAQGNWTGRFMQRLESTYVAANVVANILLIAYGFLLLKKVYAHIFAIGHSHARAVIMPLCVLVLCLTRFMADNDFVRELIREYTRFYSVYFCVAVILVTLLVSLIRRQGKKKGRAATATLLVCCLFTGLLSGCMNVREPDAEIYPIVIGYDKGVKEKYLITMKFMTEAKAGAEESGAKGEEQSDGNPLGLPGDSMAVEANSLAEGIHLINALMPRSISPQHIRLLIVSEELAKEGINELVTPIIASNLFKPTMPIVISKCSAYEITASKSPVLTASVQTETELMLETVRESTPYLGVTLAQFLYRYNAPYGDVMAIYGNKNLAGYEEKPGQKEGGEQKKEKPEELFARTPADSKKGYVAGELPAVGNREIELAGMAVFSGEKMTGVLNTNECQILALLSKDLQDADIVFPDLHEPEKYQVVINLRKVQDAGIKATVDGEGVAHLSMQADYKGLLSLVQNPDVDYIADPAERDALKQHCEAILTQRCRDLIDTLQSKYKADVMQLGRHVAGNFSTVSEWEAYNWREHFPDAEIEVNLSIHM